MHERRTSGERERDRIRTRERWFIVKATVPYTGREAVKGG